MSTIMIRSKFSGWIESNRNDALEYAKWKILAITTGESDLERLAIVNGCINGIQFTLQELR